MNTAVAILSVCTGALFVLCAFFAWKSFSLVKKEKHLLRQIEQYRKGGKKPLYSVSDDRFSALHNAVCDLCDVLETQKHLHEHDNRKNAQFVADVSHQLKTPLAGLRLYCEMNQALAPTENGEKQLALLEKTEKLVFNLLKLQKLKAAAYEMNFTDAKAEQLAALASEPFRQLYPEKRISITGTAVLRCDREWLGEAFSNIIKNACEHTLADGIIHIQIESTASSVTVIFADNGGGVQDAEPENLFNRFYKNENSAPGSTGLGLAITKEIVEKHHGFAHARNAGEGLEVTVWFPVVDAGEKM